MPDQAKDNSFDVIEFTMRAIEGSFDEFLFRKTIMIMKVLTLNRNVYSYADILVENAFRAIECRLAHMNVFFFVLLSDFSCK